MKPIRGGRRLIGISWVLLLLACVSSWLAGCWWYSSFGIDRDYIINQRIHTYYYRIRWPGDGSLWLGWGRFQTKLDTHPVLPFDLGGRFFQEPRRPIPQDNWNRWGFWWVDTSEKYQEQHWLGIPGWLPLLIVSLPATWWFRRRALWLANKP